MEPYYTVIDPLFQDILFPFITTSSGFDIAFFSYLTLMCSTVRNYGRDVTMDKQYSLQLIVKNIWKLKLCIDYTKIVRDVS